MKTVHCVTNTVPGQVCFPLRAKDAVAETNLEAALVENLRDFLLEMGHGFCLEAQQKSIVIGNRLFVSKYQLELPSKEDLERFLEQKRREIDGNR